MIFLYKCGHEGTEGLWADDKWYKVNCICPNCARKIIAAEFRQEKKGGITLVIKLNKHQ